LFAGHFLACQKSGLPGFGTVLRSNSAESEDSVPGVQKNHSVRKNQDASAKIFAGGLYRFKETLFSLRAGSRGKNQSGASPFFSTANHAQGA
jgi:hypothetical protein